MVTTLAELYQQALTSAPSSFEAGEIFRHVTGSKFAEADGTLPASAEMAENLAKLLHRRAAGEPLQYLLGEWEFYALPILVGPGVLIPRQDTETLVDIALDILKEDGKAAPQVLDLCSGSGCVAIAIKHNHPSAAVTALEFSPEAYAYLEKNIALGGYDITPVLSDLREYAHPARLDLVVSNPPYIPRREFGALQTEVGHEPIVALDGGHDGLHYFRAIARRYREQLRPGGRVLLEIGMGQDNAVVGILAEFGFSAIKTHPDLTGIVRVIEARRS